MPSASGACWPGGWSRRACRSSRSMTAAGTITPTVQRRSTSGMPALGQHGGDADRGPGAARPARIDAGDRPGRVRPHAADQQRRRPRPLVQRHERAVRRRQNARRAGDRRDRQQGLRGRSSGCCRPRISSRPIYTKLGMDPNKMYYTHEGSAGASGERSDADPGVDGLKRRLSASEIGGGCRQMTVVHHVCTSVLAYSVLRALRGCASPSCLRRAFAAPPKVNHFFPAGCQRGQSGDRSRQRGDFSTWPVQVWADRPGVTFTAEKDKGKFKVEVAADAVPGVVLAAAAQRRRRVGAASLHRRHAVRNRRKRAERCAGQAAGDRAASRRQRQAWQNRRCRWLSRRA